VAALADVFNGYELGDAFNLVIKKTAVLNTLVTMTIVLDVENSKN